jgi:hypothetical protein
MSTSAKIAVPNALILISDVDGGKPPELMQGRLVAATPSCIAVGCMADSNGETEIIIGTEQGLRRGGDLVFEGELATPSRSVAVWTVRREIILRGPVAHSSTRVRIWVNHPTEPDTVTIVLG